jgi:hypothetical protein
MNKKILKFSALLLCTALAFGACKKKDSTPSDDTSSETTTAQDQANYSSASNQSAEEADVAFSGSPSTARTTSASGQTIMGVTIDSTYIANGTFILRYSGVGFCGKARTGSDSIVLKNGPWHTQGAQLISYYNYTIINRNGKKMTLVGIDTITNVSGGNMLTLAAANTTSDSLVRYHTGTATITFDDGTVRTWSHDRQRVKFYSNGVLTNKITGLKTFPLLGINGIEAWGINRNDEPFYGQIVTPLLWAYTIGETSNCTYGFPYSGSYKHRSIASGLEVTFGVDQTGNPVAYTPYIENCPSDIKLDWTHSSKSMQAIIGY